MKIDILGSGSIGAKNMPPLPNMQEQCSVLVGVWYALILGYVILLMHR